MSSPFIKNTLNYLDFHSIGVFRLFAARLLKYNGNLGKPVDTWIEEQGVTARGEAGVQGLRVSSL